MIAPARQPNHRYTWADYQTWPDDERWEIIGGEAFAMSPSPTSRHQLISMELGRKLADYFHGKRCRVFHAAMDVRLSEDDIVQPDLLVVCHPAQIKRTHIEGPPTLVVEILSPASTTHDKVRKTDLYARVGVKEYWIVTPWPSMIEVLLLDGATYRLQKAFAREDTLVSPTFPDLKIELPGVFDFPLEPGEEPPVVREPPPTRPYAVTASR